MDPLAPLRVVCLITGFLLHVSPIPVMRDILSHQSTLNYHIAPYASVLMNHFINGYYAVIRRDAALMAHRFIGVAANGVYVYIFMTRVSPGKSGETRRFVLRTLALVALMLAHLHILLPVLGLGEDTFFAHLAFFGALTGIGLAASPLATVGDVLRNKDSSSLPFGLCLMVTVQCTAWTLYAWLRNDWSTFANNLVGVVLGSLQLALIFSCPNRRAAALKAALEHHDTLEMVGAGPAPAVNGGSLKNDDLEGRAGSSSSDAAGSTIMQAPPPGLVHR